MIWNHSYMKQLYSWFFIWSVVLTVWGTSACNNFLFCDHGWNLGLITRIWTKIMLCGSLVFCFALLFCFFGLSSGCNFQQWASSCPALEQCWHMVFSPFFLHTCILLSLSFPPLLFLLTLEWIFLTTLFLNVLSPCFKVCGLHTYLIQISWIGHKDSMF